VKLSSWPEIGSDGDVLLTPYVPKGITGYDDEIYFVIIFRSHSAVDLKRKVSDTTYAK
jgi:hypothetical protein